MSGHASSWRSTRTLERRLRLIHHGMPQTRVKTPPSAGIGVAQAAIRETKEESGIDCEITGIVVIYSDPKPIILTQATARHGKNSLSC